MNSEKGRNAHKQGHFAETKAALFLRLKGYRVVERNFKPPRGTGAGEIDLIVKKGNVLVFVEVKLRQTETAAAESVSHWLTVWSMPKLRKKKSLISASIIPSKR